MIEFREASYEYPAQVRSGRRALDSVSLTFAEGEHIAVLGPNGSGKSTLARLCDGLLLPTTGGVWVDGMDTRDQQRAWDVRARVALVFQDPDAQIVGTTVEEDAAFGPENLGVPREELRRRVDEALAAVGLTGMERREPHLLSGGQKQRLAIAGALAMGPAYVVLDEPTAMLDPEGRAAVLGAIRRLRADGRGVLHVTHDLTEAALADRVIVLVEGQVAYSGDPGVLLSDAASLDRCGLESPPIARLAAALRDRGASVPVGSISAESVVASL